jgi:hypothetical protein
VSCSNCTDYQSRPLEIRYGYKKVEEWTKKRKREKDQKKKNGWILPKKKTWVSQIT